jgi:DNA helicase-4
MSIHKAKGLEADNIILILNNSNYPYIFPSEISSDPLLDMVLSVKQEIKYAEERRLFYVALTRTKKNLYILVDKNSSNIFIDELKAMNDMNIKIYRENIE